ncbi:unnamed protein product [Symbiodinium sp. CCMP2592]|nr:unnamed protein product [Symbiodinium sp. CCMP2592]
MGRQHQHRKGVATKGDKDKKQIKRDTIPKYALFPKQCLAAYPDPEGNPVYVGDKEDAKELFDPANLLATRSQKNAEMLARPGWGLSFAASAANHCVRELVRQTHKPKKTSAVQFATLLEQPRGKAFQEAVATLDIGKDGSAPRKAVAKAMKSYLGFLQDGGEELQNALVGLATESGRLYLGAMHLLEQRAFVLKPKAWAKKLQRSNRVDAAFKSWLAEADNVSKLEDALVDVFLSKMKASKAATQKWQGRHAKVSSNAASGSSQQSSVSSSSASAHDAKSEEPRQRRKRCRKHARADKKRRSSSPASERPPAASAFTLGSSDQESEPPTNPMADWAKADVQVFLRSLDGLHAGKKNPKRAAQKLTLADLVGLFDTVPQDILEAYGLASALTKLKQMERLPKQNKLAELLGCLDRLAAEAKNIHGISESLSSIKIRRIAGVTDAGAAIIRDDDLYDEVVLEHSDETLQDVLLRFFQAQSSMGEIQNWNVKRLAENDKCEDVTIEDTSAAACPNVLLMRKGG